MNLKNLTFPKKTKQARDGVRELERGDRRKRASKRERTVLVTGRKTASRIIRKDSRTL